MDGLPACLPAIGLCCLLAAPALAVDLTPSSSTWAHPTNPGEPIVAGGLPTSALLNLHLAYALAVERLRTVKTCRDLFVELGADGLALLGRTVYSPPRGEREERLCERGVPAFTVLRSARTRVCIGLGSLARSDAATILIHEALHYAGLPERTGSRAGPSSHSINRRVRRSCHL